MYPQIQKNGCVIAERAAKIKKWTSLVIDKRNHIAGNCYDTHNSKGLLYHKYGPHYLRFKNKKILNYLSKFTAPLNVLMPSKIALPSVGGAGTYGAAIYGSSLYDASGVPLVRQTVEGSGFAVALQIDDQNSADSFSVKGFQLEFTPGGRR